MNRSDKITVLTRGDDKAQDHEASVLPKDAEKLLHDIYLNARDSARGYRAAAESATGSAMKARLFGLARRRGAMAGQMELALKSLGVDVEPDASAGDTLRHFFDDMKDKLTAGDGNGIIGGIIRGESSFADSIDKVLRQSLPASVHGLLMRHQRQIRDAVDRFSHEIAREGRFEALKQKAIEYRRPALFGLLAIGVGALVAAAVIQQRRNGAVTKSLTGARKALDRALAQLPSARQVGDRLHGMHLPSVRMPDVHMPDVKVPRLRDIHMPDVRLPSFLKFK
jgi:uncharacterized protein (TIGR02284 family)